MLPILILYWICVPRALGAHGRVTCTKFIKRCLDWMSWGGLSIWGRTSGWTQLQISKDTPGAMKLISYSEIAGHAPSSPSASSLSTVVSIRTRNSLWSLNKSLISRRRHVSFIKEGGKLGHCLRAIEQYCYAANNYIKARSHWEATSQDNKKGKK